jgi:putative transposase
MIPLEPTHYFHIYNRANGSDELFLTKNNYLFFLARYRQYVAPFMNTYCYCLMPNHVHYLVQVKSIDEISEHLAIIDAKKGSKEETKFRSDPEKFISKQWSNLFSSYTQSFNKQRFRMGSLFMKNFKRKPINDELYLKKLVHYIHNNPVEARLCDKPEDWAHSSYRSVLSGNSELDRQVIGWFDNPDNYIAFHRLPPTLEPED